MKWLQPTENWRPTWKLFGVGWVIFAVVNMATVWIAMVFGMAERGGSINVYPPRTVLGAVLFAFDLFMFICLVMLYAGIRLNKVYSENERHPFTRRDFWMAVLSFILFASVLAVILNNIGWGLFAGDATKVVVAVVLVSMGILRARGSPVVLGLTYGLGIFLIIGICAVLR